VVGTSFDGDISIDDVFIDSKNPCKPTGSCSFEDSFCSWSQSSTNTFNFLRITPQQLQTLRPSVFEPLPLTDTTTNTKYGHFIWIGSGYYSNAVANKSTNIFSEIFFAKNYQGYTCFTFSYFMNGPDPGKLIIYKKLNYAGSNKQQLFNVTSDQGNNWNEARIQLKPEYNNFELSIEAVLGSSKGNIALDDVYLYSGDCSSLPTTPDPDTMFACGDGNLIPVNLICNFIKDCPNGMDEKECADCDFENSTCQWVDSSSGSLKWLRNNASSSINGPTIDHTLGTFYGHYMYVNSDESSYFEWADLKLKQTLKPCSATCELELYYHMFGSTEDLVINLYEGSYIYTPLLEIKGDKGDQWNRALIKLGKISKSFSFLIEGVRYFNGDYDLAIDDIRMKNCEFPTPRPNGCPTNYYTCKSKGCVDASRVCDLIDDCGDGSDEENCANFSSCDFENGICDWTNDKTAELEWTWHSGSTLSYDTGPKRDHTIGLSEGHYIYLEASNKPQNSKARIISSTFTAKPGSKCDFRFFYHMLGKDIGALNIYIRTLSGDKLSFQKSQEVGDYWERFDLSITTTMQFQIVIEGVIGKEYLGDIGIDDTSFSDGCIKDTSISIPPVSSTPSTTTIGTCGIDGYQCKSGDCIPNNQVCNFNDDCPDKSDEVDCGTCNFENNWCGWYDLSDGETKWTRKQAPSSNSIGPQIDHTSNSTNGYYLITEISDASGGFIDTATLLGPRFQETASTCKMSLWIHMDGSSNSYLTFFFTNVSYSYDYQFLGKVTGPLGKFWKKFEFAIGKFPSNYQVEVFADPDYEDFDSYDDIAFDDIQFDACSTSVVSIDQSLNCDFENDFCYYYLDTESDFEWTRTAGSTSSINTGPGFDHTSGNGFYAYIESSYPQFNGDKARFFSSIQTKQNQFVCLNFWYHMFGEDIDTLNIYLDEHESQLISSNFNRTLIWKKTGSQGNKWVEGRKTIISNSSWKITFEGVVGFGHLGDISLDDLSSYDGKCLPTKSCDFEDGLCDFQNVDDNSALLKWKVGQPTFVSIDHTTLTNQGSFAFVDFQNNDQNSKGRLESAKFSFNGFECLQFWYLLNGKDNGDLNIYIKYLNDYGTPIWSKSSHNNDEWRFGQISIGNNSYLTNNYSVIFEAMKGPKNNGIAGIDDVIIKIGDCSPPINCNFEEYSICSWSQYQYDQLDWLLNQGETDSLFTGPQVDVTLGTIEGVYLYLESSLPSKKDDKAVITSEYLKPTASSCFSLWYFMHGSDVGQLNIYTVDNSNTNPLTGLKLIKNLTGEQGFSWQQLQVDVSSTQEFRIVIEGVVSNSE